MYANRLMKSGMLKNILLILIFFVGCFLSPIALLVVMLLQGC